MGLVRSCQQAGGTAAFIDQEQCYDMQYSKDLGVDHSKDKFLFAQPQSGEEGFSLLDSLLRSQAVDLIVFDSLASASPQAERDRAIDEANIIGLQARLISSSLRPEDASILIV